MIIGLKITEERGEETEGRFHNECGMQELLLERTQSLFLQMVSFLSSERRGKKIQGQVIRPRLYEKPRNEPRCCRCCQPAVISMLCCSQPGCTG